MVYPGESIKEVISCALGLKSYIFIEILVYENPIKDSCHYCFSVVSVVVVVVVVFLLRQFVSNVAAEAVVRFLVAAVHVPLVALLKAVEEELAVVGRPNKRTKKMKMK